MINRKNPLIEAARFVPVKLRVSSLPMHFQSSILQCCLTDLLCYRFASASGIIPNGIQGLCGSPMTVHANVVNATGDCLGQCDGYACSSPSLDGFKGDA